MKEVFDKSKDNKIRQNGLIMSADEVVDLLNSSTEAIEGLSKRINDLSKEVDFWKKWALEYLTDYPLYSDDFLETLKSIESEEFVEKTKERQDEIINILKKEGLWNG